jgi:hypothetical protein|tara:strand:- start:13492 stop:13941 length:450 start_codon:yes stop_codon:yes gene_type:complete
MSDLMTNQDPEQGQQTPLSEKIEANRDALKRYSLEDALKHYSVEEIIPMMENPKYTPEELEKSKRIFKSATPKYTLDWYVKWVASIFVLCAMSIRGVEGLQMFDLALSAVGISLWLWVSILWHDKALILLNGVGLMFLLRNLVSTVVGL